MAPRVEYEQICIECRLCSFYWGDSCTGLIKYTQQECIENNN